MMPNLYLGEVSWELPGWRFPSERVGSVCDRAGGRLLNDAQALPKGCRIGLEVRVGR